MNKWVLVATILMLFPDNTLGRDIPTRRDLRSELTAVRMSSRKDRDKLVTLHVPNKRGRDEKAQDGTDRRLISVHDPDRYTRPDEPNASQKTQKEPSGLMQFVVLALALILLGGGFYWMKKKRSLRN